MGGCVEVDIKVMYLGFKFGDGDYVVEVVKKVVVNIDCFLCLF